MVVSEEMKTDGIPVCTVMGELVCCLHQVKCCTVFYSDFRKAYLVKQFLNVLLYWGNQNVAATK
jgi:hypothetical protein